jgi:malonate-semialdehyde dehydrogenase (acetylating)/methylmalonate-semialdehyde dehydrogenase
METSTTPNYIGGEWISSTSNQAVEVRNPATNEVLTHTPLSSPGEVQSAVSAAKEAFAEWRQVPPYSRARKLSHYKELLEEEFENLAEIIVKENGKTLDEARGEVRRGIESVDYATSVPILMQGYNLEDVAETIDEECLRQPIGVFSAITPFNFPFMIAMWFLPVAIAAGNTFVCKPSERTPLSLVKAFELLDEIGLPEGVVNLVHGAKDVGNQLLKAPEVDGISFVGSTPVARHVYQTACYHGKRVQSNGGAKNFILVMEDADLEATTRALITSFFGCAGQRCLAGSYILAVGKAHRPLREKFTEAATKLIIGSGLDEGTQMGPVISIGARQNIVHYIESGLKEGAELVLDGRNCHISRYPDGYFVGPTIFDQVDPGMKIGEEEIFGPVASIQQVSDFEEAVNIIDANRFGNAASIFTQSGKSAREFRYRVRCGNIGINIGVAAPIASFAFGGMKDSFFGDLHGQGQDSINFFVDRKIVISRWF